MSAIGRSTSRPDARRRWCERVALIAYSGVWVLGAPIAIAYLLWRSRRQPEYRAHWGERFALTGASRPARPRIWIHAVSVGETRAVAPLVERLLARYPDHELLLTHMTPTGRATAAALFGDRVRSRYLPYDGWAATRRFLRDESPRLGVLVETELWPNLCAAARDTGVPMVLVNARLSARSLARGLRWRCLVGPALAGLADVLAQTPSDAARIACLGRDDVPVVGNLKFDVEPDAAGVERGRAWRRAFGARPVIVAASTRDGEESALLAAWRAAPTGDGARLVVVPRHPQRFDGVERVIAAAVPVHARRSALGDDAARWARAAADATVLLGDSMGEMSAYYALADVAILGGSLLPFGGQNLIEACAQGVPVVMGPHTYNFDEAARQACEAGAGHRVTDAASAISAARQIVADPQRLAGMKDDAMRFAGVHSGAADRTMDRLAALLAASPAGRSAH